MEFSALYNSSTSLQNAILNILANNGSSITKTSEPENVIEEIHEFSDDEDKDKPVEPQIPVPKNKDNQPKQSKLDTSNPNKVLTATEIIYRSLLNDKEAEDNLSGGKRADDMLTDNVLKGGNADVSSNNNVEGNANIIEDIHEVSKPEVVITNPAEKAQANIFSGGNFHTALQQYKSMKEAVDAVSSDSDSEEQTKEEEEEEESAEELIDRIDQEEYEEEAKASEESSSESNSYNSDSDDFIPSNRPMQHATSSMKKTNAKYIRLIKEFKSPSKPSAILGGSISRPKTITVVNAFPYILKANPDGNDK